MMGHEKNPIEKGRSTHLGSSPASWRRIWFAAGVGRGQQRGENHVMGSRGRKTMRMNGKEECTEKHRRGSARTPESRRRRRRRKWAFSTLFPRRQQKRVAAVNLRASSHSRGFAAAIISPLRAGCWWAPAGRRRSQLERSGSRAEGDGVRGIRIGGGHSSGRPEFLPRAVFFPLYEARRFFWVTRFSLNPRPTRVKIAFLF